jgi:hypothetical protein
MFGRLMRLWSFNQVVLNQALSSSVGILPFDALGFNRARHVRVV